MLTFEKQKELYIRFCRWTTYLTLAFTLVLGVDLLLPETETREIILARKAEMIKTGGQFEPTRYVPSRESKLLVTQKHKFPVSIGHIVIYKPGDSIRVFSTPVLNIVTHATIKDPEGEVYDLDPALSILDVYWFIPVITFLTALIGTILSRKNIRVIDFGIVNLFMLWILLQMLRILPF